MHEAYVIVKSELRRILIYALASAFMTIGLAWGIASVVEDNVEEDTQRTVLVIQNQAQETQDLLCDILAEAESKGVQKAVAKYCDGD